MIKRDNMAIIDKRAFRTKAAEQEDHIPAVTYLGM